VTGEGGWRVLCALLELVVLLTGFVIVGTLLV
jgi:hypothetical protein